MIGSFDLLYLVAQQMRWDNPKAAEDLSPDNIRIFGSTQTCYFYVLIDSKIHIVVLEQYFVGLRVQGVLS